ncbi:hypothetical protein FB565_006499 [Actinoplanes lutulentus]|uniref:Uncharacterized protein n=1 Tax=Actinoplanes lutulentus TaxID=1287878 RepID=A0A327ZAK0_9ACTN|nr:hypothetical protein [Actinoplanes lutulentus]MBB2946731.1 hypothetical protein [Actinoplanes lutulentus]RAK35623.1 hypothetical protein B0I29_10996 [Actinoplanes lutulentus]
MTVSELPSIDVLRSRCQALAVLSCIADQGEPFYHYTVSWGDDEAAFMDHGSGDEWAIVFTGDGAFIRIFDHESPLSPYGNPDHELRPGLLDGLPEVFRRHVDEKAFSDETGQFLATAVLWRLTADDRWHTGTELREPAEQAESAEPAEQAESAEPAEQAESAEPAVEDGSDMLDILLDDIIDEYVEFAEDYYETDIDQAAVEHVINGRPLTEAVVQALNPETTLTTLRADLTETGYPLV